MSNIIAMLITSTFLRCPTQQYTVPHYFELQFKPLNYSNAMLHF